MLGEFKVGKGGSILFILELKQIDRFVHLQKINQELFW